MLTWWTKVRQCAFLPTPSAVSSARGSEFITYLLPNICTNWSKNLHSCFSPLETRNRISELVIRRQNVLKCTTAVVWNHVFPYHSPMTVLTFCLLRSVGSWPSASLSWSDTVQECAGSPGWPWPQRSGWRCVCSWCSSSSSPGSPHSPICPRGPRSPRRSRAA